MALKLTEQDGGVRLSIKAVPGASRDRIVGELGDALKVAVTAAPEGGKANRAIVKVLAAQLGVNESAVQITRGQSGARKEILISGTNVMSVRARLASPTPPSREQRRG